MQFRPSRQILLLPTLLGGLNLVFGLTILTQRAMNRTMALDFDTIGAVVLAGMGTFFLQVAWKLSRYQLTVTDAGLVVGQGPADDAERRLPWSEIEKLETAETKGRGRKAPGIVYRIHAGKRQLAFTSLLFKNHQELATVIAERSGKTWQPEVKA